MLKIIGIIAGLIAIVVIGVLAYAATLPNAFRVERSISIKAPPEKIFPLINELKTMNEWNPFAEQDPSIKITYSGPASGKGAAHAWTSDRAGEGRLEITESTPSSQVNMRLDMIKPMEGHNAIVFALQPQTEGTNVRWAMSGEYNFITKVVGLLFNMDRMIGGEFDKGLADLKAMAEKS
jgi:carbon monoxide dehydrogenase subunit G